MDFDLSTIEFPEDALRAFESPIENELARVLRKYLHENALLENQIPVQTSHGDFRLDFLVSIGGRKVALEANGKRYHVHVRDLFRAALILGATDIHAVYYLKGIDIMCNLPSALYAISREEPTMFSPRGLTNLATLTDVSEDSGEIWDDYDDIAGFPDHKRFRDWEEHHRGFSILRLSKSMKRPIWKTIYSFAQARPDMSLDELLKDQDKVGLIW